jgi:nitrate/TMAO reductase-like tetraheme cytochrome c subunit
MEDEHIEELRTPPSLRLKIIKIATMTLLFLVIFFTFSYAGMEGTSSSSFCATCHEMKPQFYTWKASNHSEVDCVSCHVEPGLENELKSKAGNVKEVYKKYTQTYIAPITMPKAIPDEACEKCHNINTRNFTPSGDLIIPHDKHKKEGIECIQCHSGIAHAKIAERKVTFKSDYEKWSKKLGESFMSDTKFTRPQMDTCMDCHRARKISVECETCHTTSMLPEDHNSKVFKAGGHGKITPSKLPYCDKCHSYMSKETYDLFEESSSVEKFLSEEKDNSSKEIPVSHFAKTNTFCKDCHNTRPASHMQDNFFLSHGTTSKTTETCFTCHDNRIVSDSPVTTVACGSCHTKTHRQEWKKSHPIPIGENQKFGKTCLTCHVEKSCKKCHRSS